MCDANTSLDDLGTSLSAAFYFALDFEFLNHARRKLMATVAITPNQDTVVGEIFIAAPRERVRRGPGG